MLRVRRATARHIQPCLVYATSTHAPHAGSDGIRLVSKVSDKVSTHAPHARSDIICTTTSWFPASFNPCSPCEERRKAQDLQCHSTGFNPRSPCEERLYLGDSRRHHGRFQPTLPMRGATIVQLGCIEWQRFQPTLPMRGATVQRDVPRLPIGVSTHAPHARSDRRTRHRPLRGIRFNPRSPCEERRAGPVNRPVVNGFQPTLPMRGATSDRTIMGIPLDVSTHAPHARSDFLCSPSRALM